MLPTISTRLSMLFVSLLIFISISYGQQLNAQEGDVIKQAQALFDKKNYQEALPLFAQLVSVHPENPEYNYKFGVCTFYGDRSDRRRPIRYLSNALKSMGSDSQLHYYLGMAYYQNEEFAEAMKFFNLYLAKLDAGSPDRPVILEKVNACLNGLSLEHSNLIDDILITAEFQKDNFHRAYRADDFSGMLILKPENFINQKESTAGINSFVYISEPRGTLYFSGYESSNNAQRDIFKVKMLENGDWGVPEKISDVINTNFDEAYPVLTDYGTTLYFCSKGHNSIGGYDVFRSKLDTASGDFSAPENLGKGINSPFDDILFIPDKSGKNAYFASDRDNLNGGINVYKIKLIDNAFGPEQVLAQNSVDESQGTEQSSVAGPDEIADADADKEKQEIANVPKPKVAPQEKAANLMNKRTMVHQLADTAYLLVAETKNLIRNLTNKRDRANAISSGKSESVKNLEVAFEEIISGLPQITSDAQFNEQLSKAVELKKEIFQFRERADHANHIAWKYGKQIKIKDTELDELKKKAGEVQTLSLSGDYDKTLVVYNELMANYRLADSLSDYSTDLLKINSDDAIFDVPATELAFADELRTGYENHTLLATAKKPTRNVTVETLTVVEKENVKPEIIAIALVESVGFTPAYDLTIEDEVEINFIADAIDPVKQVETIDRVAVDLLADIAVEDLDVNFNVDAAETTKLVEPVEYESMLAVVEIDETALEINFSVDAAEALALVTPVVMPHAGNIDFTEEDELEINFGIDAMKPLALAEAIDWTSPQIDLDLDGEVLEISTYNDRVVPAGLVQAIAFNYSVDLSEIEENPEINFGMDAIVPVMLAEAVEFNYPEITLEIIEGDDIQISSAIDAVEPAALVQAIAFNYSVDLSGIEDQPEIGNIEESMQAVALIDPIEFTLNNKFVFEEEPELEISEDINVLQIVHPVTFYASKYVVSISDDEIEIANDPVNIYSQVEMIAFQPNLSIDVPEDELQFSIEPQKIVAAALVETVAFSAPKVIFEMDEEALEISTDMRPETPVIKLVNPVFVSDAQLAVNLNFGEETLAYSRDQIAALPLVAPVYPDDLAYRNIDVDEEELEISQRNDRVGATTLIRLAEPVYQENLTINEDIPEEIIEIDFSIDYIDPAPVVETIAYETVVSDFNEIEDNEVDISFEIDDQDKELITSANSNKEQMATSEPKEISQMPALETDLFYLRESVSIATDIETSRTDVEMLKMALSNPRELSYEELLFSASLANNVNDKLAIYNQAFIHIDRDWRAFNNAAVAAMNERDFEKAECYLYQASLISEDNGKVQNNMGVLACYMNDFNKAEEYFTAASHFGVDSDYNLSVVKNMSSTHQNMSDQLQEQIGEHKYYEVLGEAINPVGKP